MIPQAGFNPDVFSRDPMQCVGGPCDGQEMQVGPGHFLFVASDSFGGGVRAVSLSASSLDVVRCLGACIGHYEPTDNVLYWVPFTPSSHP